MEKEDQTYPFLFGEKALTELGNTTYRDDTIRQALIHPTMKKTFIQLGKKFRLPDDIVDHHLSKLYSNESWVIEKSKKIIEYLEKREFNEEKYHTMIERITARDKLRGDNVLNYFPEWKPHFKDSYYG